MSVMKDKAEKSECEQKGESIYFSRVLPTLGYAEMKDKIVAIDIDSGHYTIADITMDASLRLRQEYPDARVWMLCIGHDAVRRTGYRRVLKYG